MSKKLGFIGCGNMGKAMIHGVMASGKALLLSTEACLYIQLLMHKMI